MGRGSNLFGVTVILLRHSLPSCLPVSVLRSLSLELLNYVVGGPGCSKKRNIPGNSARLFSGLLGNDVERRGIIGASNKRPLSLALKHVKDGFTEEQKIDLNITLELGKACFAPVRRDQAVHFHCLGVV